MTLKRLLLTFFMVMFVTITTLSAKGGSKTIKTKINDNVYLKYYGEVENKIPMGNGEISLFVYDKAIDVISGKFNNQTITDATLIFKGTDIVFKGDVKYITSDKEIVYTISNGFFEIPNSQYIEPQIVPITENITINRMWNDLRRDIPFKQKNVVEKHDIDTYNDFVGAKPVIMKEWTSILHLKIGLQYVTANNIIIRNSTYIENIQPKSEETIECYVLDYGDKGKGILTKQGSDDFLKIKCSNGDSITKIGRDIISILRNIDGGKLELNKYDYDGNFDIERKTYDKDKMPLVEKFNRDVPDEYRNWIGKNIALNIYNREKQMADNGELQSYRNESRLAVEVTYSNGDTYYGTYYKNNNLSDEMDVMNATKLPQDQDYFCGVFTTKQGEKTYYLYGFTANEYVQLASQKDKGKKDEWQRQQQEARNEYQAREKAAKDRRLAQEKKYGKKYVDAIYDQYTILVGTPEGLLKEQYILDVKTETTKSIVYYVKRTHDVLFIVWVDKSTHKVDMVTNLQE